MWPIPGRYWLVSAAIAVVIVGSVIGLEALSAKRAVPSAEIQSFNAQTYRVVLDKTVVDRPEFGSMNVGAKDHTSRSDYLLPVSVLVGRGDLIMAAVADVRVRVADAPVGGPSTGKFSCPDKQMDDATPQELLNANFCWLDLTLTAHDRRTLGL